MTKKEVHLLREGCCSTYSSTSEFEYDSEKEILMNQYCNCSNPNFCSCESDIDDSDSESGPEIQEKLKVCMFQNTGD